MVMEAAASTAQVASTRNLHSNIYIHQSSDEDVSLAQQFSMHFPVFSLLLACGGVVACGCD
jgi:hypothetical protein